MDAEALYSILINCGRFFLTGWAVLIVFSGWATVALVLAILHVMNFWTLPGSP